MRRAHRGAVPGVDRVPQAGWREAERKVSKKRGDAQEGHPREEAEEGCSGEGQGDQVQG